MEQLWGEGVDFKVIDFKSSESKRIKKKEIEDYQSKGYTVNPRALMAHKAGGCLIKSGDLYGLFGFDDYRTQEGFYPKKRS